MLLIALLVYNRNMDSSAAVVARRHQAPALQLLVSVLDAAPYAGRARAHGLRSAAGWPDGGVCVHVWGGGCAQAVLVPSPPVPQHAAPRSCPPSVGVGDAFAVLNYGKRGLYMCPEPCDMSCIASRGSTGTQSLISGGFDMKMFVVLGEILSTAA